MSALESQQCIVRFLKDTILNLEAKQVAESIVLVASSRRERANCQFEVIFEEATNPKPHWLDSKLFTHLNAYLCDEDEHNLVNFYNIPQKTTLSHTCQNFIGLQALAAAQNKRANPLKGANMLELLRKRTEPPDRAVQRQFDACHQCKCLFKTQYLLKCNYRSSTMGLPQMNPQHSDPLIISHRNNFNAVQGSIYFTILRNSFNFFTILTQSISITIQAAAT